MLNVCPTCNGSGRIVAQPTGIPPPPRTAEGVTHARQMIQGGVPYRTILGRLRAEHEATHQEATLWAARARRRLRDGELRS